MQSQDVTLNVTFCYYLDIVYCVVS